MALEEITFFPALSVNYTFLYMDTSYMHTHTYLHFEKIQITSKNSYVAEQHSFYNCKSTKDNAALTRDIVRLLVYATPD